MAGISGDDIRALNLSIQDLTRAERDLLAVFQRQGPPGSGGTQAPAGAGGIPTATGVPTTASGAAGGAATARGSSKADSAPGFGLSSVRQIASAGGAEGLATLAGGLAGGPVGLATAGAAMAAKEIGMLASKPNVLLEANLSGRESAPLLDTSSMARRRGSEAANLASLDFSEAQLDRDYRRKFPFSAIDTKEYFAAKTKLSERRREERQDAEDDLGPQERTASIIRRRFAGLARAGGFRGEHMQASLNLLDDQFRFELEMQKRMVDLDVVLRHRDGRLRASSAGTQGALQGR